MDLPVMRSSAFFAAATCLLALLVTPSFAVTRRVPSQIPGIQAALDSSATGDTVLVEPGDYSWTSGALTLRGKSIVLRSEAGPTATTLRSSPGNGAIGFSNGEDSARLEGFTISVGDLGFSAAIGVGNSTPAIDNCVITGNRSSGDTAGIGVYGGSPSFAFATISNTIIAFNECDWGSGAAVIADAGARFIGCTFHGNRSGSTKCSSVGAQLVSVSSIGTFLERTIISGSPDQMPIRCESYVELIECCNFFGNACGDDEGCLPGVFGVNGNISVDPMYCDPTLDALDFSLASGSPCLPGNHPDGAACELIGARGEGCDPTATTPASWGHLKSLFR